MKTYNITMSAMASWTIENVKAEDEEEAMEVAFEKWAAMTNEEWYSIIDVNDEVGYDDCVVEDTEDGVMVVWHSAEDVSYNGTLRGDYDRDDMLEVAAFVFGSRV